MMARAGLRIGVVGATGTLGTELLELLDRSSLRVSEIVPIATDRSLGRDIDFQGSVFPVETDGVRLTGLDLVFLCAPAADALDFVRRALQEQVPCVDLSGATAGTEDVPMRVAGYGSVPEDVPLLAIPRSPALALVMALQPIAAAAGLRRVSGAVLESASWAGKDGMAALYQESIAVFNQQPPPESTVFPAPVAFDCMSGAEELDAEGLAPRESALIRLPRAAPGPRTRPSSSRPSRRLRELGSARGLAWSARADRGARSGSVPVSPAWGLVLCVT